MSKHELRLLKEFQAELNAIQIEHVHPSQAIVDAFNLLTALVAFSYVFFFILH